jgi:hypothetical protein
MAKQVIDISTPNSGQGTPLREAFDFINQNFTELYTDDAADVNSIIGGASISVNQATGNVTVTNDSPNATHTGDVTGAGVLTIVDDKVITSKILDANVTTAKIANDGVTFAKLENRYTALSALGSGTAFALNFSAATTFTATASGAATLTFSNAVQGQVIDLIITGNHALTFAETGATFNKVGSTSYAGGSTNLIQIICTDDSSGAKIYHYSIATYAAAQPQ